MVWCPQIVNKRTQSVTSQARLRINATESAQYSCRAENVHKEGRTNVSWSAFVHVRGLSNLNNCLPSFDYQRYIL